MNVQRISSQPPCGSVSLPSSSRLCSHIHEARNSLGNAHASQEPPGQISLSRPEAAGNGQAAASCEPLGFSGLKRGVLDRPAQESVKLDESKPASDAAGVSTSALEPFQDYSRNYLAKFSPERAGIFVNAYTAKHFKEKSTTLALLKAITSSDFSSTHYINSSASLRDQIDKLRSRHGLYTDAPMNTRRFLEYTTDIMKEKVGNCMEMTYSAARAAKEFGYPYDIAIIGINKESRVGTANHGFLRFLRNAEGKASEQDIIVDPLFSLLTSAERKILNNGKDFKTVFSFGEAEENLIIPVVNPANAQLVSAKKILNDPRFLTGHHDGFKVVGVLGADNQGKLIWKELI